MIMQNGLGGAIFGGADIPGFLGEPSQEMWVRMYQAGMYYPFFRAHSDIAQVKREPWIQTQRVQDVIRDAINRRYDMIHYLYTTFYRATKTGEPLVRPMWFEFPEESNQFSIDSQFMLGDSMLVAPKIDTPTAELEAQHMQEVTFTLPTGAKWYNNYSKKVETVTGEAVTRMLPDLEQAVFIKGGSVMPTLLHDDCYALTKCINDKIRLDVYIDDNGRASGSLYTDDGISFEHETDAAFAEVNFTYDGGFRSSRVSDASKYDFPKSQTIDQVVIYGLSEEPNEVLQDGQEVPSYIFKRGALMIVLPGGVAPDQVNIELVNE
jgi:mannosyl-oligosaccharide alpha-1,3-glucosidase